MNAPHPLHPTAETLQNYGLGKLDDRASSSVSQHLESCSDCRRRVGEVSSDSFLGRVRAAEAPGDRSTHGYSRPSAPGTPLLASSLPPGLADHPDYEVSRELGRGGMGVVYLAHNRLMGRPEVLKVIGRHVVERPEVLNRFLREIRAVARLKHPNVVAAHHAFRLDDSLVFAMEYVEGQDLAKLVKTRGPLPIRNACAFIHQAALGLQHAYEEGMVHRDIKPHNLILGRRGEKAIVKILDFGLAKVASEGKIDGALTHSGQMLGSPYYVAPEQTIDAQSADILADIYSLGCSLYHLLTGHPPFQGPGLYDILQAHQSTDAKPLNFERPEVPVELAAVVAKMMAKDPNDRYRTPIEVAVALEPFFRKSQAGAVPVARPPAVRPEPKPVEVQESSKAGDANPEAMWASLIDIREAEPQPAVAAEVVGDGRPRWPARSVLLGSAFMGLLFIAWIGGFLKVKTAEGVILLENLPKDAEVFVAGDKVTLGWAGAGKPLEIRKVPGQYTLEVKKDGFSTFVKEMTIKADGLEAVTVRLEPLPGKEPVKQETVAAAPPAQPLPPVVVEAEEPPAEVEDQPVVAKEVAAMPAPPQPPPVAKVDQTKAGEADADDSGFVSLFNGKDLTGWTIPIGGSSDWSVENGTIRGSSPDVGATLATERSDYGDFHLKVEIRSEDELNKQILVRSRFSAEDTSYYTYSTGLRKALGRVDKSWASVAGWATATGS